MRDNNFTIDEIATCLGVGAMKVDKLARTGQLPGDIVDGVWRFNRIRFISWMQRNMHTIDTDRLMRIEVAIGHVFREPDPRSSAAGAVVTNLIPDAGVDLNLPARTRQSVLSELVRLIDGTGFLYDGEQLLDELRKREEEGTTALSRGVAIPHPRRTLPYATAQSLICLGRVPGGIGYGQSDGGLSRLFFLISCHEDAQHLRVLARLTRMLDPQTVAALLAATESEDALAILAAREEEILARDP